jgi:sodium/potassium/calcium exchanger 6
LLVSLGFICGVNPSILGLTVLAWGNSIGDLVTNLTMALNGGPEGAQIAISGCYAGPIFNTVVGLGLSLVTTTWCEYPSSIVIPKDPYLWETLAFLVIGLIWALVVLIKRDMKLDAMLGGGLLAIYFSSLILRLIQTLGTLQFKDMLV